MGRSPGRSRPDPASLWPEACMVPDPSTAHPEEVCARRAVTRVAGLPVCDEHRRDPAKRLPRAPHGGWKPGPGVPP